MLKTGLNNVVLPTLFNVVNNTEQVVELESSLQSGVTILNNIVDNIQQYGQHNIVQSCFQQLLIFCCVVDGNKAKQMETKVSEGLVDKEKLNL